VKKSSAKSRSQRDDRTFAEFEATMRRLAKASKREMDAGRAPANGKDQTRSTAT
jgi:hypothetical protein